MTTSLSPANENLISVRGNTILVLGDCQYAWRIQKGTVAVFAVRMRDAAPHGPRRYLFSCNQRDWLFNQSLLQDEYGFLAVGLEDSLLEKLSIQHVGDHSNELYGQLDEWVRRVESTTRMGVSPHAELASDATVISLSTGECLKAPMDTVFWTMALSGQIRLSDQVLDSSIGWMPLCGEDYLVAESDSTARLEQSRNASRVSDLLEGLGHYHRIAFRHLSRQEAEEQTRNAQRLEARQRNQQHDTAEVLWELGSVLSHKPVVSTSDDPLHLAMTMVGKQLSVQFAFPEEVRSERSMDSEVEAIARRSRIRARNVVLRGQWWTKDSGPILGKWSANGNPISLIRGERGYSVFDPVEGTTKPVDNSLAQLVSRDAIDFGRSQDSSCSGPAESLQRLGSQGRSTASSLRWNSTRRAMGWPNQHRATACDNGRVVLLCRKAFGGWSGRWCRNVDDGDFPCILCGVQQNDRWSDGR